MAADNAGGEGGGSEDWSARREALTRKLAEQRARMPQDEGDPRPRGGMQGVAEGLKLASEFLAGILVGTAIGYGIDKFAGTSPFGLIVFLLIGFAAGAANVIRSVSGGASPWGSNRDEG
ncbi:AtpZ/AtpI family protein [Aurantimonas sp. VKM B-3413]|uniref:AtpZ/AtpI family protein n=1 Tax=Aurantimonas sp. VKM B-3413 TaxID=2779401 RepID=UPI001E58267C|nr:AtpZ/AtpI family protein [Aurantimonas sp. VKM B-3413]MCB8838752.1 AtpZ/AtpI family protein [Aurantimonas sp. VKM B-3413]